MKFKKLLTVLLDVVELYIPLTAFCVLFVTFIWSVIARYLLNTPCSWATDVELGCYIWVVLFSASYVMRLDKHVRFSIVYDMMGSKFQLFIRLISNLLIIIPFALLLGPTYRYLAGLRTISTALRLPLKYYYAPILWFIASVMIYAIRDFVGDIRILCSRETEDRDPVSPSGKEERT